MALASSTRLDSNTGENTDERVALEVLYYIRLLSNDVEESKGESRDMEWVGL